MGRLEVALIKGLPSRASTQEETYIVNYLSPFYGVTSIAFEGNNSGDFNDVQKSYGWWAVPPDVGTTVMVIFIEGDPNQGYWIGCIQDEYQNQMVPGISASNMVAMTPEQRRRYGVDVLPVAEFNKSTQKLDLPDPSKIPKPIHPFADRLLAQGLLADNIRGVTSSSARRDIPSSVFGISTPGPLDPNGKRGKVGYANLQQMPVSRLGGSSFVMDDGDVNGQNELVRIRTRTGHQILLHNTNDLIYIANSRGTAWIELTSNGKIDIYAADSVSIRTESDFNFRADGDINLEAGGNINMSAGINYHLDVGSDYIINAGQNGILTFGSDLDINSNNDTRIFSTTSVHVKAGKLYVGSTVGELHITSKTDMYQTSNKSMNINSVSDMDIKSGGTYKATSTGNLHITTAAAMYQTPGSTLDINAGGVYKVTAPLISVNGATAAKGTDATGAAGTAPDTAEEATTLPKYSLPNRSASAAWGGGQYYKTDDLTTILTRVPTHEPWDDHESVANPATDAVPLGRRSGQNKTAPSVKYTKPPALSGTPPSPTGNVEEDNIAAFLWMIRVCEGTSGADGYKTMFTGIKFDTDSATLSDGSPNPSYQYKDHPRIVNAATIKGASSRIVKSSAAGAYQFLTKTWNDCKSVLGLSDFSPASQDKACILLLRQCNALADIRNGNFTAALQRANKIWASLPGSPYDQNPRKYDYALNLYKTGGGTYNA
jgi:hypothetical protein